MKYRVESTELEAIDSYVRITLHNKYFVGSKDVSVLNKQRPSAQEVANEVMRLRGVDRLFSAELNMCSRVAEDARNNKIELGL